MGHIKLVIYGLLVVSLALLGWFRKQYSGADGPLLYVAYWREGGKAPVYYAVKDSSHFQQLGNCVTISDGKGERRVLCRNYKVLSPGDKRSIGRTTGKRNLIPAYMRE